MWAKMIEELPKAIVTHLRFGKYVRFAWAARNWRAGSWSGWSTPANEPCDPHLVLRESRYQQRTLENLSFRSMQDVLAGATCRKFDDCPAHVGYWDGMDVERIIDDIEQLQEMFEAPDIRPLSASDISAANRRHDDMLAHSPWFRLWQQYGVCCRSESPVIQLPE